MAILFLAGCKKREIAVEADTDILIQVCDSILTTREVTSRIPSGLNETDSIALFNSIVENWLRNRLMSDLAKSNIKDFEKINRLTEEFRNNLIIEEYLKSKEDELKSPEESEIAAYYRIHKEELTTSAPLVKGMYIKIADNDEKLPYVKRWMRNGSPSAIDNIEKHGLREASQYDLFKERWVEWSEIADNIPYRFYDADAFMKSTKDFETSFDGWTYLLHIYDFIPSGQPMPQEYAYKKIEEILNREKVSLMRNEILHSLYQKGIKDKTIKVGKYKFPSKKNH